MKIADLTPDKALSELLDGNIEVSDSNPQPLRCYVTAKFPNRGFGEQFIVIRNNGVVRSITRPIGVYRGNLVLTVYCKANADMTAKTVRIRNIISRCMDLANGKTNQGFYFAVDASNVITPVVVDQNTNYATESINVAWRTI